MTNESLSRHLMHIAKHVTAMTQDVKEACLTASARILQLEQALEAVDSEVVLGGQLKEIVDAALDADQ